MSSSTSTQRLVVFDTNVIERYYLAALLKGEPCRDFERLRTHHLGYTPALYIKSFYEICDHIKLGTKRFPWMTRDNGYPGGLDKGRQIIQGTPRVDGELNLYWWFGLCEEWQGIDWDQEAERVRMYVKADQQADGLHIVEIRRQFTAWKYALTTFCERVWDVLSKEMVILSPYDVYGADLRRLNEAFQVEQELAFHSMVPSEDFEIVVAALLTNAAAFITDEKKILSATALSLGLNWQMAFVHATQLTSALENNFQFRWTPEHAPMR
jgi:hypothetical protein